MHIVTTTSQQVNRKLHANLVVIDLFTIHNLRGEVLKGKQKIRSETLSSPWLANKEHVPKNVKWGETLIKIPRWNNKLNEAEPLEKP